MQHMNHYTQLRLEEREQIFFFLSKGKSVREIGRLLQRNHRTIGREIKRNQKGGEITTSSINYSPSVAQTQVAARRAGAKKGLRRLDKPFLKHWVIRKLGQGWSPEQIAGRLKLRAPQRYVSHETIYQFIYAKENRQLKLAEFLRRRHQRRQEKHSRSSQRVKIPGRIPIQERPLTANQRLEVGHWETDNMEGKRGVGGGVSATVERKCLLTRLSKVASKAASQKEAALERNFAHWPTHLIKTITYDNGTENFSHQNTAKKLKCQTYFCHPYHSWEKGTVENTIGLVREYLPKGMDLSTVTQGDLSWIADQLNQRPRKKLGYYTPSEIFEKETGWVT